MAAQWLARRDGGALSHAEEAAFVQWLDASVAHRVSYLRLDATWTRTQRLAALEHREHREHRVLHPARANVRLKCLARGLAALACLIACAAAGWNAWGYSRSLYRTEIGALRSLPLDDGSRVTLNTDSSLRVKLSKRRREIDLRQGEAFFEVARDNARPFVVHTGAVDVEVVGTQFSVQRTRDAVRVLVNDGHVRVRAAGGRPGSQAMHMVAGDIAVLAADGTRLRHATPEELAAALSWRQGQIVFRDTPLAEAVAEFNRYRAKPLVITDPQLAAMRIGGTFRTANADGFLQLLQQAFDVRVSMQEEAVLLTRR